MPTRPLILILLLATLAALFPFDGRAASTDGTAPSAPATQPDQNDIYTPAELHVINQLGKDIKQYDCEKSSLETVFNSIHKATGINIIVDWASLKTVGVEKDTPITFRLKNIPAEDVLKLALQQASAGTELNPITFVVLQNTVRIAARSDLDKDTTTRIYQARDLLTTTMHIQAFTPDDITVVHLLRNSPDDRAQPKTPPAATAPDQDTQTPESGDNAQTMAHDIRVVQITTLVKENIGRPEEWATAASTITEFNNQLIIRTTIQNHREITLFLKTLSRNQYEGLVRQLRDKEIYALLARADALRLKQQYEPALALTNQALRVDPNHPAARAMKEVITATLSRPAAPGRP